MNYPIQRHGSQPAYLQLYQFLREDITEGNYSFGSRIPSKRLLAEENQVSVVTAEHALSILAEEGYIEARPRSGYYVIYRSSDFSGHTGSVPVEAENRPSQARIPEKDAVVFSFSVLARTVRRVLLDYSEELLVKPPNSGCEFFRDEISRYLARSRGLKVHRDQIVIGAGAEYLYGLIGQMFREEKQIAVEDPSYDKIRSVYQALGLACDLLKLGGDGIRSAELARTKARILHVTPFHSYPSHVTASVSKKKEYLRWARERQGYLIEDNYDSELTISRKAEDSLFAMSDGDRVIYINTFSKTIAPALRVGYMILPVSLSEPFCQSLGFYSCTVPVLDQCVLTELLRTGDYERHINRVRRARRKQLNR